MAKVWLQGVVRNGQVVLDTPLDLPDGTVVAIVDREPDAAPPGRGPRLSRSEVNELDQFVAGLRDRSEWPAFQTRLREVYGIVIALLPAPTPPAEELPVSLAGMWAHRPEMADAEGWVRRLRGARE